MWMTMQKIPKLLKSEKELGQIYPPRSEATSPPSNIEFFRGFSAQYKYNDIRTLFHLFNGEVSLFTRKLVPVKEYNLTPLMKEQLLSLKLDESKFQLLDGGIMRHLTIKRENPLVLWDILVHDGYHLLGTTYRHRYSLLKNTCGDPTEFEKDTKNEVGLKIGKGPLWLAPSFQRDFGRLYQKTIGTDYLEGIILKDVNAKLDSGASERNNTSWQIKIRKPTKSTMF